METFSTSTINSIPLLKEEDETTDEYVAPIHSEWRASSQVDSRSFMSGVESQRAIGNYRQRFDINRSFAKYSIKWWWNFFARVVFAWCFVEFYCIFIIGMVNIQVDLIVSIYSVWVEKILTTAIFYTLSATLCMYFFWYSLSVLLGFVWECVILAFREKFDLRALFWFLPDSRCAQVNYMGKFFVRTVLIVFLIFLSLLLALCNTALSVIKQSGNTRNATLFTLWFCSLTLFTGMLFWIVYTIFILTVETYCLWRAFFHLEILTFENDVIEWKPIPQEDCRNITLFKLLTRRNMLRKKPIGFRKRCVYFCRVIFFPLWCICPFLMIGGMINADIGPEASAVAFILPVISYFFWILRGWRKSSRSYIFRFISEGEMGIPWKVEFHLFFKEITEDGDGDVKRMLANSLGLEEADVKYANGKVSILVRQKFEAQNLEKEILENLVSTLELQGLTVAGEVLDLKVDESPGDVGHFEFQSNGVVYILLILLAILSLCVYLAWWQLILSESNTMQESLDFSNPVPYPLCQLHYSNPTIQHLKNSGGLSITDSIVLTSATYMENLNDLENQLTNYYGGEFCSHAKFANSSCDYDSWQMRHASFDTTPKFFHLYRESSRMHVISVRGSFYFVDWIEDAVLWNQILAYQLLSYVFPLIQLWPKDLVRKFVSAGSWWHEAMYPSSVNDYYMEVEKYMLQHDVPKWLAGNETEEYGVVVGHSLGGGVAQIVAARLYEGGRKNVISIGVSSPGTALSSEKFGFDADSLSFTSVTVAGKRDPVPMVDEHGGLIELIECDRTVDVFCHLINQTLCEVASHCFAPIYFDDSRSPFLSKSKKDYLNETCHA